MEKLSADNEDEQIASTVKSWISASGDEKKSHVRSEGAVLKRTSKTYINAKITYWSGTYEEPKGALLRLVKMIPRSTAEWDFDNPEDCIELRQDGITVLRDFLNQEFNTNAPGNTFWVPVPDQALAKSLEQLLSEGKADSMGLKKLTDAMSLDDDLITSILESNQAELLIQVREGAVATWGGSQEGSVFIV